MNRRIRIVSFAVLFSIVCAFCSAQVIPRKVQKGQEAWRYLIKAENAFDNGDYHEAVKFAEQCKTIRRQDAAWQTYILENTLKKAKVRREGDALDRIMPTLRELEYNDAIDIINNHCEKLGTEYFDNSYSRVFDYIKIYAEYPEADYLLGKIYRLEGEDEIAFGYMKNAYDYSVNLDVPMEKTDLLYDLADLSINLDRKEDYEKYLLLVVMENDFYRDSSYMRALVRTITTDSPDSMEKFFLLYRCDGADTLNALIKLGQYYGECGQVDKMLRCNALAAISATSKIESIITQRLTGYEYFSIGDLLLQCARYSDIVQWGNNNCIWQLYCSFAASVLENGNHEFARMLTEVLAENLPEEYWALYSKRILESRFSD